MKGGRQIAALLRVPAAGSRLASSFAIGRLQKMELEALTHDQLISRIHGLESRLQATNKALSKAINEAKPVQGEPTSPAKHRPFDATKHSSRLIALKFAYLGQRYHGFEHNSGLRGSQSSIEEQIWKALVKARLISPPTLQDDPELVNWDGCDYSKCGRTDRGVSAFGQVIGIRVRSNRQIKKPGIAPADLGADSSEATPPEAVDARQELSTTTITNEDPDALSGTEPAAFDEIADEIQYPQLLNRLLPSDIRVLAWCPAPPDFSARFSCRERRYRYFFTQPAFNPTPGAPGLEHSSSIDQNGKLRRDGWLDIDAMKAAAKKYEGLHDFRNLCKVDASKQLDHFVRRIFLSEIREVDPANEPASYITGKEFAEFDGVDRLNPENDSAVHDTNSPRVYQFVLHGSAFLWHQVRHMVAVLFLVGQGLESPSVVDELLDIQKTPGKPNYEMADDQPLVLWDCVFPDEQSDNREDALRWVWVGSQSRGDQSDVGNKQFTGKFGNNGVVDELWQLWRKKKMDEVLAGSLLDLAVSVGGVHPTSLHLGRHGRPSRYVYQGGDSAKSQGIYVPLMEKAKLDPVEVINAKWRARKGVEPKVRTAPPDNRGDHDC